MSRHKNATGTDIHVIHAFTFADAAARTGATGLVAADIGKVAKQTDDDSYWLLTATTPTWAGIVGSTSSEYNDGGESRGKDRTIGNNDAFAFSAKTNNIIRQYIKSNGDIGFGPAFTAPLTQIHLRDDNNGDTQIILENQDAGALARSAITLAEDAASTKFASYEYINSGAAGANLNNLPNSAVFAAGASAANGLLLGARGATASVKIFAGGNALATVVAEFLSTLVARFSGIIQHSKEAGITAFATGGQASATLLTKDVNEIATVGTAADSVKLPPAIGGQKILIINNGANAADVFPNTSDNLGSGVDTAASLAAGANITYGDYDATNWVAVT